MAWMYLGLAAALETVFAISVKYSEGFSKLIPSAIAIVGVIGAIGFFSLAVKTLPVSVAYPIFTAAGTLGTVVLGFAVLGEGLGALKIVSVLLVIAGITGLRIASA